MSKPVFARTDKLDAHCKACGSMAYFEADGAIDRKTGYCRRCWRCWRFGPQTPARKQQCQHVGCIDNNKEAIVCDRCYDNIVGRLDYADEEIHELKHQLTEERVRVIKEIREAFDKRMLLKPQGTQLYTFQANDELNRAIEDIE